jgi:hypothetical protein
MCRADGFAPNLKGQGEDMVDFVFVAWLKRIKTNTFSAQNGSSQ